MSVITVVQPPPAAMWERTPVRPRTCMRPILFELISVNHNAPPKPPVIELGLALSIGRGYSVITPKVVIRPTLLAVPPCPLSVNQSAPSDEAVMPEIAFCGVGRGYCVRPPAVVMRPILLPMPNHNAPSGPAARHAV